jgi:hypothetical protein
VVMRIADGNLRLHRVLHGQRKPVIASERHVTAPPCCGIARV